MKLDRERSASKQEMIWYQKKKGREKIKGKSMEKWVTSVC